MSANQFEKTAVVILAAGQGKRMKSDIPKVMHHVGGEPMIGRVVKVVETLGIKPVVVVSNNNNLVREFLGERADYAVQGVQLGTANAVAAAESVLKGKVENVAVLYGDQPYFKSASLEKLVREHIESGNTLTLTTVTVSDFEGWRAPFYNFGRVVRGQDGKILKSVEKKDATEEELKIKEINPCHFCFRADWLWENLKKIKNNNAQGEYYLTDLVEMALKEGAKISSITMEPKEAIGVNCPEDIKAAEEV